MGVGEPHPLGREAIQVGCRNFRIGVLAGHVAVTHVVCKDENDVWFAHFSTPNLV